MPRSGRHQKASAKPEVAPPAACRERLETSNPQFWAVSLDMIRTSKGGKAGAAAGAARGAAAVGVVTGAVVGAVKGQVAGNQVALQPQHMSRQPPPGAPPNGSYQKVKFVGSKTWWLCCLGSFCYGAGVWILLCPCDEKEVWQVGATHYDTQSGCVDQKVGPCKC